MGIANLYKELNEALIYLNKTIKDVKWLGFARRNEVTYMNLWQRDIKENEFAEIDKELNKIQYNKDNLILAICGKKLLQRFQTKNAIQWRELND